MERFLIPIKQFFRNRLAFLTESEDEPHVVVTHLRSPRKLLFAVGGVLFVIGFIVLAGFLREAQGRFLPNTTLGETPVGGLTPKEALLALRTVGPVPPEYTVELIAQETTLASSSAELGAHYDLQQTVDDTLAEQQHNTLAWLQKLLWITETAEHYELPLLYNQQKLADMVLFLQQGFDTEPHFPQVSLTYSGSADSIVIDPGEDTFAIQNEETLRNIVGSLANTTAPDIEAKESRTITIEAAIETRSKELTEEQVEAAEQRATNLVGESLVFEKDHAVRELDDTDLVGLLSLPEGYDETVIDEILAEWAEELNRPPQNAEFEYNPETLAVQSFTPHRNGWELDVPAMKQALLDGLWELENTDTANLTDNQLSKELLLAEAEPEITLEDTNDLGIKERIGFGESYYYHSIPNRIHNVSHTANKISLTIVPPGKEFSFNQTLGDVSTATGFRPAYVIKDGQTLLGDGGGVCQVSTTLFRSLLDAGLQITRRLQHSYRVSYYELDQQPGFDATVYAGNVDLRFINDTDHHVLIYMETDPAALYMTVELYGTSDGRTTEITGYKTWDYRPALPPEYAPDPSLAPGELRQVDWAASGIKAEFTHIIRDKDGNVMDETTYYSNYRPWAAKYLQGV